MSDSRSKRRKGYFSSNLMMKKRRDLCLQPGFKGFICTTNGEEKQCIRESYNILNEYADKIYGEENKVEPKDEPSDEKKDIMDEFKSEIESMQAENSKGGDRRFQAINTGVINCVFIKTNLDDPVALMDHIAKDLYETRKTKTRFLMRMIPIDVTCKAYIDEVEKAFKPLVDKYFKNEPTSFSIQFNRRHNSNLERDIVINKLANLVNEVNKDHKVNLTNPSYTISVEILKNICCLSVIRDYFKYCKYNLNLICDPDYPRNPPPKNFNQKQNSNTGNDTPDGTSASDAVEASENTAKTVPPAEAQKASELDVDANSKGEPAPEAETIVPPTEAPKASEPDADANCKGEPAPEA